MAAKPHDRPPHSLAPPPPEPRVKLFAAVLYRDESALEQALVSLAEVFSPVDSRGAPHPFDLTDYYEPEMGPGLSRMLVSFTALVSPTALAGAKHASAAVEDALRGDSGHRTVNVDVGHLDAFKVVLASFKARGQKLYLGRGVWADLTLTYAKGHWRPLEWTFPDFRDGRYDAGLLAIRERFKVQLRETEPA